MREDTGDDPNWGEGEGGHSISVSGRGDGVSTLWRPLDREYCLLDGDRTCRRRPFLCFVLFLLPPLVIGLVLAMLPLPRASLLSSSDEEDVEDSSLWEDEEEELSLSSFPPGMGGKAPPEENSSLLEGRKEEKAGGQKMLSGDNGELALSMKDSKFLGTTSFFKSKPELESSDITVEDLVEI